MRKPHIAHMSGLPLRDSDDDLQPLNRV
jgi:hypothetical protein